MINSIPKPILFDIIQGCDAAPTVCTQWRDLLKGTRVDLRGKQLNETNAINWKIVHRVAVDETTFIRLNRVQNSEQLTHLTLTAKAQLKERHWKIIVAKLPHLESLRLCCTSIQDSWLEELAHLYELKELDLSGNATRFLTAKALDHLDPSKIERLKLTGCTGMETGEVDQKLAEFTKITATGEVVEPGTVREGTKDSSIYIQKLP